MGWHMKFVICVQLAYVSVCLTREMSVVREWTSLDVQLTSGDGMGPRRSITSSSEIKSWLMYNDRLFVTLVGHPYLAYLDLTDNSTSALLRPYPSYKNRQRDKMYHVDKVRVDRCDRLWVLSLMDGLRKHIIAIDLKTDTILKFFTYVKSTAFDMTVDDFDCDNEYVYISSYDGVWTNSWTERDSWYHSSDPISPMILVPNSIVYYNLYYARIPMVYYMSTSHLRDKSNKTIDIWGLNRSRKLIVNLASSALDAKSDVLYYFNNDNKTVIHAVPCWTSERCSSNGQDDIVVSIDPTHKLRYLTVDENGDLWAITSSSEDGERNIRLLSVPVKRTCVESNANDTTNTSTDVESNTKDTTDTSTNVESNTKDTTDTSTDVESNTKVTTNTSTGVESNTKDTTNMMNINEITTAASSATEQTSTPGSVHKHTTANIADTTAGTPNSNITQAVGGTNMPHLLFSFTNTTFNLSNFTIINNFPN